MLDPLLDPLRPTYKILIFPEVDPLRPTLPTSYNKYI